VIYQYNVASMEDGTDVTVLLSMGSPCSDLGPDEVVYVNDDGQIVIEHDESGPGWAEEDVMTASRGGRTMTPRIGPRMRLVRDYVTLHPGASVTETVYATHTSLNRRWVNHQHGREAVYRAERAGLIIIDRIQSNRYRLYDAELVELEARREAARDEYWRPGHP
jgi:hypothetical protein